MSDNSNDAYMEGSVLEQDTSRSLAATLELARAKGYIDNKETKKQQPKVAISKLKKAKIEAKAYIVDEKRGDDRRNHKFRPGPSSNQVYEVKDPEDWKPEINLEYTDDMGRKLETPKEAYNYMCYKFHGQTPGKNKVDKRLRKQELERKMKQALSTDVPASAALMIAKQKELQTPFIVLDKGR
uniref:U4/U6.U5 tri-snRNP-associated protein 1 n=1 Tax=Aceria tosichella TaxID=561515 RepID=A0A6G1S4X5_9ACAR